MLSEAKRIVADREAAEKAEAQATAAFSDGIAQFRSGLSDTDRAFERRAFEIFSVTASGPNFDRERAYSSEDVAGFLRLSLGVAKQLANAEASARIGAEFDALDRRPGYMEEPDNRKSYADYLNDEIQKRVASGAMAVAPQTEPERISELQDLSNPRADAIDAAWRIGGVGPHKPSGPRAEIQIADDEPNSLDTELEVVQRNGWNLSQDRDTRKGFNIWNRASRRKR